MTDDKLVKWYCFACNEGLVGDEEADRHRHSQRHQDNVHRAKGPKGLYRMHIYPAGRRRGEEDLCSKD